MGKADVTRTVGVAPHHMVCLLGVWNRRIEATYPFGYLAYRFNLRQPVPDDRACGESLQIPRRVLAEETDARVLTKVIDQQSGMSNHHLSHFAEVGWLRKGPAREHVGQITE